MSKVDRIDKLNVEITCRSCLIESDQLTSLFAIADNNDQSLSLGDILANISHTTFESLNKIDLPTNICDTCQQELLSSYTFKIKTEKSEELLNNYLQRNKINNVAPEHVTVESDYEFLNIKVEQHFENELGHDNKHEEQSIYSEFDNNLKSSESETNMSNEDDYDDEDYDDDDEDDDEEYEDEDNNENDNDNDNDDRVAVDCDKKLPKMVIQGRFHCDQCTAKFSTQAQLDNHMKIHVNGDSNKFYCSTCDRCFATNRNLQRHTKLHLKEQLTTDGKLKKDYHTPNDPMETDIQYDIVGGSENEEAGDECKDDIKLDIKIFKPETKLKPSIDRNYPCGYCSSRFSNKAQLDCHMKAHTAKKFFCEPCNTYFVNNRNLQRHLKLHYGQTEFKCTHCDKLFESKLRWKLHERTHFVKDNTIEGVDFDKNSCMPNETKMLNCKICGMKFHKIFQLRAHLITHSQAETINIDYIQNDSYLKTLLPDGATDLLILVNYIVEEIKAENYQKFYSATNMVGNELQLSDSETDTDSEDCKKTLQQVNLYYCELCSNTFTRRYQILYHQRTEHLNDIIANECGFCGMKYVSKHLLEYHVKTQCGNIEKQFTCDVCKVKYMWKENIEQHIRIHHTRSKTPIKLIRKYTSAKKLECEVCQKKFSRPEHLGRHLRTHNPAEKKFECNVCQKRFSRKDNLKSHMKVHEENHNDQSEESKSFLCVFCGRKFRNSSNLVVHTRRHTGEKPFKCDFCDKGFPRSSDLRTHRRTHTGEKPHLCTLCGKGFSRSNKLTRHMRIHSGIRPYKCTYCDRAFTQSNDLTIHVRRHTGEKPYVCGICGERFIQGTALQNHRKSRGHWEEGNAHVPFSYISQNNPNPLNNSGRVDRIGMPKNNATGNTSVIEPQPLQRITTTTTTITPADHEEISSLNYKDIASFVNVQHSMQHVGTVTSYEIQQATSSYTNDSN